MKCLSEQPIEDIKQSVQFSTGGRTVEKMKASENIWSDCGVATEWNYSVSAWVSTEAQQGQNKIESLMLSMSLAGLQGSNWDFVAVLLTLHLPPLPYTA